MTSPPDHVPTSDREPWFSAPGWSRVKVALLMLSAVLIGAAMAASQHGDVLVAGLCAMGSATGMFVAGVLVGHDIGQRRP